MFFLQFSTHFRHQIRFLGWKKKEFQERIKIEFLIYYNFSYSLLTDTYTHFLKRIPKLLIHNWKIWPGRFQLFFVYGRTMYQRELAKIYFKEFVQITTLLLLIVFLETSAGQRRTTASPKHLRDNIPVHVYFNVHNSSIWLEISAYARFLLCTDINIQNLLLNIWASGWS